MKNSFKVPQLLLRMALGVSFLSAVADRLGLLGIPGSRNIEWGNWENFLDYTATMMPFLDRPAVKIFGGIASIAEALIGILLIIGFKTRLNAIASCGLTLIFALVMTVFLGIKAPINFSVFTVISASLLLSRIPDYDYSIDDLLAGKVK